MRVLVTGAAGQLGTAILAATPSDATVVAATTAQLDVTRRDEVMSALAGGRFDVVMNCAAFTAVDHAEEQPEPAFAVNATAVRHLAAAAGAAGTRVIHFSTDYVFAGDAGRPYRPDDVPRPLNQYGASKLAGERELLAAGDTDAVIIRTAWLYSTAERSFPMRMLARLRSEGMARVVDDQIGTPTSASQLASFAWQVTRHPEVRGCLHWTDGGVASWYDFAVAIAEESLGLGLLGRPARVLPVSSAEYPTRAARPHFSVLDKHSTARKLELLPLHWRQSLHQLLKVLPHA